MCCGVCCFKEDVFVDWCDAGVSRPVCIGRGCAVVVLWGDQNLCRGNLMCDSGGEICRGD